MLLSTHSGSNVFQFSLFAPSSMDTQNTQPFYSSWFFYVCGPVTTEYSWWHIWPFHTVRVSDRRGYWWFALPLPLPKPASTQASIPTVEVFPFLVHLAWVFKYTPDYNSYLQLYLDLDDTYDLYYNTKGHFSFF